MGRVITKSKDDLEADLLNKANNDQFKGDYVPLGGIHSVSLLLGVCLGGAITYGVYLLDAIWLKS